MRPSPGRGQGLGRPETVESLEFRGELGDELRLVGLEVPDHGPIDVEIGHLLGFAVGFLHFVLAQFRTAGGHGQADALLGNGFAHGQQFDVGTVPAGAFGGRGDPAFHLGDVGAELLDCRRRRVLFVMTESAVVSHIFIVLRFSAPARGVHATMRARLVGPRPAIDFASSQAAANLGPTCSSSLSVTV